MFFNSFYRLRGIIIVGVLFYISIIVMLRLSGKRTLSDLNAFDFVVTVTIGSIAATTILSADTSFTDGLVAVATLIILQYIVARLNIRFKSFGKILKSDPTLVFYKGNYLTDNMKKMRISKEDILQEIRNQSNSWEKDVNAVILESNGKLSVIKNVSEKNLDDIEKYA